MKALILLELVLEYVAANDILLQAMMPWQTYYSIHADSCAFKPLLHDRSGIAILQIPISVTGRWLISREYHETHLGYHPKLR